MTRHPFAITLDERTSLANHTGLWRTERPVYVHNTPPCNTGCPAGEDIRGWLRAAEDGSYETAWRHLTDVNPFPGVMGRVCYHPCETACNRAQLDTAVGINSVERFLGDQALDEGWLFEPPASETGRRVLVVGAGPSGLSAAYQLRRKGHQVVLCDSGDEPGGMMRSGIPTFRLPRDVLDIEIARVLDLGIHLRTGYTVTDIQQEIRTGGFDAAFVAGGARLSHRAYLPAGQSARILDALEVLAEVNGGERPRLGRRVAVYGGGNTAMDVARTARRLGADEAVVIYRRTRERMPADPVELEEALQERINVRWLSTVASVDEGHVRVERMRLDDSGVPQGTGEFEDLEADALVLAIGQDVDHSLVDNVEGITVSDGQVQVDDHLMTGSPGIFAGGDMVPGQRSVAAAVGHGGRAAREIDAWLRGSTAVDPPIAAPATFDTLNTWYYTDAPHAVRPRLAAGRRTADFSEVVRGLDGATALYEARRCLSCGSCFGCDNCYGVCPDNAVYKVADGDGYAINYDYCKGCGLCVAECPAGAIDMVREGS